MEARYKLELVEVKTRDETGSDWFGSDEILVIADLDSIIGVGSYELWISDGLGDMDSDEKAVPIKEGNACLLLAIDDVKDGVWGCSATGHALPVTLTFTVLEHDGVGRVIWEQLTGLEGAGFCNSIDQMGDISKDCLSGGADEFNEVGSVRKHYTATDLAGLAVGQSRTNNLVADYCRATLTIENGICSERVWTTRWNGRYRLTVRVTRLRNVLVNFDLPTDPLVPSVMVVQSPS